MNDDVLSEVVVDSGSGSSFLIYGLYAVAALIVLILIIWVIIKLKRLFTQPELRGLSREEVQKRWQSIRQTSEQGEMGIKLAIMEADVLLDSALKSMMMPGKTLGERLRYAAHKYPRINQVWSAHNLRNRLAHEATFYLSRGQAKSALDDFEKALKLLNVL